MSIVTGSQNRVRMYRHSNNGRAQEEGTDRHIVINNHSQADDDVTVTANHFGHGKWSTVTTRCGVDIGGTLAKIAYIARRKETSNSDSKRLSIPLSEEWEIHFSHFPSKCPSKLFRFVNKKGLLAGSRSLRVTGGGAYKYKTLLTDRLGVDVEKVDEMSSIITGLDFVIRSRSSLYTYDSVHRVRNPVTVPPSYPYLVVNIGSGVSVLKVTGAGSYSRISGTCIGGGTVLGLGRKICGAASFDQMLKWAEAGSNALDLKVGDLIGDAVGSRCIPPDTLASSFGRLYVNKKSIGGAMGTDVTKENIAWSLVHMVSYNIGNITYLLGKIHHVKRAIFTGKFVNNRRLIMESLTEGVEFYKGNKCVRPPHLLNTIDSALSEPCDCKTPTCGDSMRGNEPESLQKDILCNRQHTAKKLPPSVELPRSGNLIDKSMEVNDSSFQVLFMQHDGYLGALGCLVKEFI